MTASIDPFVLFKDRFGRSDALIPVACNWVDNIILAANTAANYTVPANAKVLLFSYSQANAKDIFVNNQAAAAIPVANVANGVGNDISPSGVFIVGTTTISFICEEEAIISIRVYGG